MKLELSNDVYLPNILQSPDEIRLVLGIFFPHQSRQRIGPTGPRAKNTFTVVLQKKLNK